MTATSTRTRRRFGGVIDPARLLHRLRRPQRAPLRRRLGAPALSEARAAAILRSVRRLRHRHRRARARPLRPRRSTASRPNIAPTASRRPPSPPTRRTATAATKSRATASPAPMRSAPATSSPIRERVVDRGPRPAPFGPDRREPPADAPHRLRHRLCRRHPALPRADPQPLVGASIRSSSSPITRWTASPSRELNAGGRVSWRSADQKLQVAATAIHDNDERRRAPTSAASTSATARPPRPRSAPKSRSATTRPRPASRRRPARHRDRLADRGRASRPPLRRARLCPRARGRLRRRPDSTPSENGTRKFGIDARARLAESLSLTGSAWHEDYLGSDARRIAGRALIEYRGRDFAARAGLTIADDRLADGRSASSHDPPARRDQALLRQPARARRADRDAARRREREHRLPGPPPARRPLRGDQRRRS